jgi:hypothetical protein
MMRRYLLFCHFSFYATGGWNDFAHDFHDLDAAVLAGRLFLDTTPRDVDDPTFHIVDLETGTICHDEPKEDP